MCKQAIEQYMKAHGHESVRLRAVLFDMDGVLYNSMPYHAKAWHEAMAQYGYDLSEQEAYMHEGRTGASTINLVSQRQRGVAETPERIQEIYEVKSSIFNRFPPAQPMQGALELMTRMQEMGLKVVLVTGSGQKSLLAKLNHDYPGIFHKDLMVTAFDVKYGKPDPEPYLMGMKKAGVNANECIVVENAPLGVRAGVAAGIFTVALNTGLLPDDALLNEGANILFPSMQAFYEQWETIKATFDATVR